MSSVAKQQAEQLLALMSQNPAAPRLLHRLFVEILKQMAALDQPLCHLLGT
jgi:hypothetical protein